MDCSIQYTPAMDSRIPLSKLQPFISIFLKKLRVRLRAWQQSMSMVLMRQKANSPTSRTPAPHSGPVERPVNRLKSKNPMDYQPEFASQTEGGIAGYPPNIRFALLPDLIHPRRSSSNAIDKVQHHQLLSPSRTGLSTWVSLISSSTVLQECSGCH